jgi:hypothetical protein
MFDTIEHLKDPLSTLQRVRENLRPGGFTFISTGDVQSLTARLLRAKWRLLTPPQHLWFFSARSLPLLLDRLGFRVVSLQYPGVSYRSASFGTSYFVAEPDRYPRISADLCSL